MTAFRVESQIKAISSKVFQSSFIYKLSIVDFFDKESDIIGDLSPCGYFETRCIPPNHVIAGIYGTRRHPKGSPKRITSLGFILMNTTSILTNI